MLIFQNFGISNQSVTKFFWSLFPLVATRDFSVTVVTDDPEPHAEKSKIGNQNLGCMWPPFCIWLRDETGSIWMASGFPFFLFCNA
jgi:hypothetical protein